MGPFFRVHLPAILWTLLLGVLLLAPGSQLPGVDWGVVANLSFGDKLLHAAGFGILAWLTHRALSPNHLTLAVLLAIAYGGLLEIGQTHLATGRDGTAWDVLANTAGAVAYAGLALGRRGARASARGRIGAHESHRASGKRRAAAD